MVNGFIRIFSTDKLRNPLSERYKRKRAGQKGIGRFAVQRLGEKLMITTQTLKEDFALVLTIDWNMWWAVKEKTDFMYGKDFVVKQLSIPNRYYSFKKEDWYFIVLDSNNDGGGAIDEEQMRWLENELNQLPANTSILIMSHYPILSGCTNVVGSGNHKDSKEITKLFYKHKDKTIHCISGHVHLLDATTYNGITYYCNGSVSGSWWGGADKAQKSWYHQTPPGYTIIDLYKDGSMSNIYYPHNC